MDVHLSNGRTIIHLLPSLKCALPKFIPFPQWIQISVETAVHVDGIDRDICKAVGTETDLIYGNTGMDDDCAVAVIDRDAILIKYTHREDTKDWGCFDTSLRIQ